MRHRRADITTKQRMDFESNSRETTKWRVAATAADALVIGSLLWSSTIGRLQPYRLNRPHYKESRDDDQQCIAMDLALGIASINRTRSLANLFWS
jgi:hypothetical protein